MGILKWTVMENQIHWITNGAYLSQVWTCSACLDREPKENKIKDAMFPQPENDA